MKVFRFSFALMLFLAIVPVKAQNYSCEKWTLLDIPFLVNEKQENPLNLSLSALFTHEGGETMIVQGFYNDNNEWIVRFCPSMEGKWNYQTSSSLKALAGLNGRVEVSGTTDPNEHGPIVIAKNNPEKFSYADGTPYFLLAFELDWLFALDAENADDIPRTRQIIGHVKENGFNQVVMNVFAYDANWGEREKIKPEHNFSNPVVFPFKGNNENPDYSALNIDFFKRLDRVIHHLDEQEIVAHLMIYVWNKNVNWPVPESEADNLYFDYVVKRYQAFPNLVWDISKEALAYGRDDMGYITRRIDRLRKLDAYNRLLSVHDYAYCAAFPGKVDFISIQEWRPNLYNLQLFVSEKHLKHPVFNIEHGGYEKSIHSIFDGSYTNAMVCLDRNYQCIFAGSYSTYYWQNTSWYEVIYNPESLPEADQPKFSYFKHLAALFQKYDYNNLNPIKDIYTPACLTDGEKLLLFYVPVGMCAVSGGVPHLKNKAYTISWYNTLTGEYTEPIKRNPTDQTWIGIPKPELLSESPAVMIIEIIE